MKIIAFITAIVLAATMTVTAVLKPPAVEVESPVPVAETAEPMQPKPAPVTEEEIIKEPVPEEIPEPTAAPEKEIVSAPALAMEPISTPTPAPKSIVDYAKTSPKPIPEIVVDHAETEPEIIIDSAKTGGEVEETPVIIEEPAHKSADLQAAMDIANAYAQTTYGVILDTSLGFDNSGYRFPANSPLDCSQEFLNGKACGIVDYTFQQLMAVNHKTIDDVRSAEFLCNIYVYRDVCDVLTGGAENIVAPGTNRPCWGEERTVSPVSS